MLGVEDDVLVDLVRHDEHARVALEHASERRHVVGRQDRPGRVRGAVENQDARALGQGGVEGVGAEDVAVGGVGPNGDGFSACELAAETLGLTAEALRVAGLRDALRERLAARPAAEAERARLVAEREAAARTLSDAYARRGGLDARLDGATRDRAALASARADLSDARKEQKLYSTLRRAFGRHGIPSLIIEETLPDVEDRANVLLDRLTGGTTRVSLETLKDNKTGGTRETLDITITDAQGAPRAYEMYSGGEAFRVNFALRIALSQLLAERAGTQIRTLVIDEGFGTQDAEGLHALVSAIRTIQDDFDKILVVTHLEELKNAFPVRIEVRKDPVSGSTFDVVGI